MNTDSVITIAGTDPSFESRFLEDFKATKVNCEVMRQPLHDFALPTLQPEHPHGLTEGTEVLSCSADELHPWLGAVVCGLDVYEGATPGNYVSTFVPPEPHSICRNGIRTRWTGMVSTKFICTLLEILQ